jgi:hypothetical protein
MNTSTHYDLLVCGGGPAGFPAAIQAARQGARVLLVEKSGILGGTTTLNRVAFPGLFDAWGKQIIAGIGWDLVREAALESGHGLPDFSEIAERHWHHQIRLCPTLLAAAIDREVLDSGCDLLLHTVPASVSGGDDEPWQVQLCGKEGLHPVTAQWLIDCSGDANLAALAGCELRTSSEGLQPGTLVFRMEGYEMEALDVEDLDRRVPAALASGELHRSDLGWGASSVQRLLQSHGNNAIHIPSVNASTSRGKTEAEVKGRQSILRIHRFLKKQPGLENLRISWCAAECGIRETRSIVGESTVRCEDYLSGRLWEDAVCYSYYPIDLHTDEGLDYRKLEPGVFPTLPLSAMTPKGIGGILVAGRCISGDRLANSAFRVQASSMAMGQGVGAVAACAVLEQVRDAALVSRDTWRRAIAEQGGIVPQPDRYLKP